MRNTIRNKYKKGNDIFNLREEEKKEIKTHPKKSILLEEYLKRNEYKPERNHKKIINTQNNNFTLSDKFENTFQLRGNRCKLREEQEDLILISNNENIIKSIFLLIQIPYKI